MRLGARPEQSSGTFSFAELRATTVPAEGGTVHSGEGVGRESHNRTCVAHLVVSCQQYLVSGCKNHPQSVVLVETQRSDDLFAIRRHMRAFGPFLNISLHFPYMAQLGFTATMACHSPSTCPQLSL